MYLTGKHRVAHKPNSKPKEEYMVQLEEEEEEEQEEEEEKESGDGENSKAVLTEEELWARLDELERLEEEQDERDRWAINSIPPSLFVCRIQDEVNKTLIIFKTLKVGVSLRRSYWRVKFK